MRCGPTEYVAITVQIISESMFPWRDNTTPCDSLRLKPDPCDLQLHTLVPKFLTSRVEMRSKGNMKHFLKPAPDLCVSGINKGGRVLFKILGKFCSNVLLCSSVSEVLGGPNCFKNQIVRQAVTKRKAACGRRLVKPAVPCPDHVAHGGPGQCRQGPLPTRNLCWDGETVKFSLSR